MRGLTWVLLVALWVAPGRAEMDAADYKIDQATKSGSVRDNVKAEIAREIEEDARKAQREIEDEARRRAQVEAEEAARPYPQRLLQARCTLCHPADNYLSQRHTEIGWNLVILRMRWLNRAPVRLDEHIVLARELARLRPAAGAEALAEYGLGAGALTLSLAVPALFAWGLTRRIRRRPRV